MQNTGMQGSTPTTTRQETPGEPTSAGLSRLSDNAQQTMERFTEAASEAASRLTQRGEALMHGPAAEQARAYMRAHPLATIGVAVAVGLLLSRLLNRR